MLLEGHFFHIPIWLRISCWNICACMNLLSSICCTHLELFLLADKHIFYRTIRVQTILLALLTTFCRISCSFISASTVRFRSMSSWNWGNNNYKIYTCFWSRNSSDLRARKKRMFLKMSLVNNGRRLLPIFYCYGYHYSFIVALCHRKALLLCLTNIFIFIRFLYLLSFLLRILAFFKLYIILKLPSIVID